MALAAISLVAAPTIASAAPIATPLTQPASETVSGDNALKGGRGGGFFIAAIAVVVIGLGIYIGVHHRHDRPNSP